MKEQVQTAEQTGTIALVGNPNVGKSTLFNALTRLHQHTGNWSGKTVDSAQGSFTYHDTRYTLVDLPGTYSLQPFSAEEEVTRDYLLSGSADVTLVVVDATCLERNLTLVLQTIEHTWPVVVCVNLMDEARKRQIRIDTNLLESLLGCSVVVTEARRSIGLNALRARLADACVSPPPRPAPSFCASCRRGEDCRAAATAERARQIARQCVSEPARGESLSLLLDRVLTSRIGAFFLLAALLLLVLWLTIAGAQLPSQLLSDALGALQTPLRNIFHAIHAPWWLTGALVDGVYRTMAWVISVMLPPMAIFFPLFTLLEDAGLLPRVAFDLDHIFERCGAHGRQSLTMCMGLGCNACGVMGCRIIQSRRERLIAIITNSFMPCNGRFPTLIAVISMFLAGESGSNLGAAAILTGCILLAVGMTFVASWLLSRTVLHGGSSSFSLELPPYRMPNIGQVLLRSLLERTLLTLGRAVSVAAPAGLLIWIAANVSISGQSVLLHLSQFLEPLGLFLGMDGVLLLAFLLAFPAGEIFIPCALMGYLSTGMLTDFESLTALRDILVANDWTVSTALCVIFFTLFHFPCGTTCLTIRHETGSMKWTLLAAALPTFIGAVFCMLINLFL
ncbi:MAG: ferrous iron transporter B [Oscillospiraceae bacterium]|nr:ferrous iron transporter B [Oscillospiraceae bacterium]